MGRTAQGGALIPRKGQRLAIAALARLPRAQFAIAGAGDEDTALCACARDQGVAHRVHILGQVGHELLPGLLSAADALVLPSASEGLANAWVEALACGTPIVIPDIGGAREVVHNHSAGRIAVRDPEAIAVAVAAILRDPPTQDDVAANVRQFSWESNAAKLVKFWSDTLASVPRNTPF